MKMLVGHYLFCGNIIVGGSICLITAFYGSILYTISRLIYTILYAIGVNSKPPCCWRTNIFIFGVFISVICSLGLSIGAVVQYT